MVYVHVKQSQLNKYVGKDLKVEEIEETLIDMGMDLKGVTDEKDPELKVEITAEKADMVSAVGIARAISYYRGIKKGIPKYKLEKAKEKVIVKASASKARPKTVSVILRNISMTQELLDEMIEIQEKIHDSFGRHRKKVSIGIYPCDDFKFPVTFGAEKPEDIVFRPLESDSKINGQEILEQHDTGKKFAHLLEGYDMYPVFRDGDGKVLSMPPIINSHETGKVDLHHSDLFIELSGSNLTYLDNMLKVMVTTFIEMGAQAQAVTVEYEKTGEVYELSLDHYDEKIDLDYVNRLIGFEIKPKDVEGLLNKMMYGLKEIKGNKLIVQVPSFRADVWHDVDIADDIARAYGYNNIVPTTPRVMSVGEHLPISLCRERFSDSMVSLGFTELYTYMLTSTEDQFVKLGKGSEEPYVKLVDSAEEGINMMRVRVLPEVLRSLHFNRKNKYPQKVFENGFTIQVDKGQETGARNELHLAGAIADPKANYTEIKGAFDAFAKLNELDLQVKPAKIPFMIEGRSAEVFYKKKSVGFIGELHPQVLENFGLLVPVACFELIVDDIFNN